MSRHPTFKLYRKPPLASFAQDKRRRESTVYIGHVVIGTVTHGIVAHLVGEGDAAHFEGELVDWQSLVRAHVQQHLPPPPNPTPGDLFATGEKPT